MSMKLRATCVLSAINRIIDSVVTEAEVVDINAEPAGGFRELHYRLISGEAGWVLQVDRVIKLP